MQRPTRGTIHRLLERLNQVACRVLYHVTPPSRSPLPEAGPVLLVSDHSSFSDPMVLAATAGRSLIFLTAREVYQHRFLKWLCKTCYYIPVSRGTHDVGAVRAVLRTLGQGEVVTIFPEGGINENRQESGHPGIGYLALKTGAPVVPATIAWDRVRPLHLVQSLLTPGRAVVRYGSPLMFSQIPSPDRQNIREATTRIIQAIRGLRMLKG